VGVVAIDTATKRASAVACGLGFLLVLPVPDGAIGNTDRPHVCDLYAMAADPPISDTTAHPVAVSRFYILAISRSRIVASSRTQIVAVAR